VVLSEPRDQSFFVAPIKEDLPIFRPCQNIGQPLKRGKGTWREKERWIEEERKLNDRGDGRTKKLSI